MLKNTLSNRTKSNRLKALVRHEDTNRGNRICVYINGGVGTVFDPERPAQFLRYHQKLVELMQLGYDITFE